MSCRHSLALGTCKECYPETGTITPEGPGDSLDGPGAVGRDGVRLPLPAWMMRSQGLPDPDPVPPPEAASTPVVSDEDMCFMAELNAKGDTKYTWNKKNARECEAAHEHFNAMRSKGFIVFKVKPFGRKSKEQVQAFDPNDSGYVYVEGKDKKEHPYRAELAKNFEPDASYVATPMVRGG